MNVGIIGLGRIGLVHTKALNKLPDINILAISDVDEEKCRKVSNTFNINLFETDFRKILENKDINAVWICSPSIYHYEQVYESLKNGKYVFCEKPLETNLHKIEQIISSFPDHEKRLMVGFNRRFDINFLSVKNNLAKIGKPTILKIISRDPEPPPLEYVKKSGGIFMDMTIHDLDMANFMAEDKAIEVFATGSVNYTPEIQGMDLDTALVTIVYENGMLCSIDNSRKTTYGYDQRLEILGDTGKLKVKNQKVDIKNTHEVFFMKRYEKAYENEIKVFHDCYKKGTLFPCTAYDARNALKLAIACNESVQSGRKVVLQ